MFVKRWKCRYCNQVKTGGAMPGGGFCPVEARMPRVVSCPMCGKVTWKATAPTRESNAPFDNTCET